MNQPTRGTTGGDAYLDLQKMAKADGRATDWLLALYALEGFLDRLNSSSRADDLVLKGGVLLAGRWPFSFVRGGLRFRAAKLAMT